MLGVFKKNGAAGVTNRVIEDKIGAPSKLTWGHVSRSSFACTDGRWQMSSMYTPGSDIGEFILAVNAANKMKKPEDKLTSGKLMSLNCRRIPRFLVFRIMFLPFLSLAFSLWNFY